MNQLLDFNYLKKIAYDHPYYHGGLGSIRLKITPYGPNEYGTINFYSKKHIPVMSKYVHTHPTNLYCEKLYGTYENIIYGWKPSKIETDWCIEEIECQAGTLPKLIHSNVSIYEKDIELLEDNMVHTDSDFHDINLITDNVITKMVHKGFKVNAKIIRNKKINYTCGLSQRGEAQENWEIIRKILNEL